MSTTDTLIPGDMRRAPESPKRSRFAGERLGAWLFAASFSIGIWGLALKILDPAHPTSVPATALRQAVLAPSGAADGRATVVWRSDAIDNAADYTVTDGAPATDLYPSDGPTAHHD